MGYLQANATTDRGQALHAVSISLRTETERWLWATARLILQQAGAKHNRVLPFHYAPRRSTLVAVGYLQEQQTGAKALHAVPPCTGVAGGVYNGLAKEAGQSLAGTPFNAWRAMHAMVPTKSCLGLQGNWRQV